MNEIWRVDGVELLITILLGLALLGLIWAWAVAPRLWGKPSWGRLREYEYAHRGLHNKNHGVPENSLPAFRLAAQYGFGMELDLQLTRDNRVVVHHDPTIARSCGADKKIADLSLEELWKFRLFGTREQVPLFSQLLQELRGKTPLIIEIKGYNDPAVLCPLVMEELRDYPGEYCVESFDPRVVRWFRIHHPQVVRGQLMTQFHKGDDGLTAIQALVGRHLLTNWMTRPDFEAYEYHKRKVASLGLARALGMQEVSWTLRSREDFQGAKALGNLCIFEGFMPLLEETEKRTPFEEIFSGSRCTATTAEKSEG